MNSYFICNDSLTIKKIFESLRQVNNQQNNVKIKFNHPLFIRLINIINIHFYFKYPKSILGKRYLIKSVRDLTTGYDSTTIDYIPLLPISKGSQMITFTFENGLIATLRTSGTEPKIKYYAELCSEPENLL